MAKKQQVNIPVDAHETFVSIAKSFSGSDNVAAKLKNLYELQQADLQIDALVQLRGELPSEVEQLRGQVAADGEKINALRDIIAGYEQNIRGNKTSIEEYVALKEKYQTQLDEIKNSREYDSLVKEIENVEFSILVAEKKVNELRRAIDAKNAEIAEIEAALEIKNASLAAREEELAQIIDSTAKEEMVLMQTRNTLLKELDDRTINAYESIRNANKNHLAVVTVYNNKAAAAEKGSKRAVKAVDVEAAASCGGCFHTIPPQKLIDIRENKKMIICEYCGRILVNVD